MTFNEYKMLPALNFHGLLALAKSFEHFLSEKERDVTSQALNFGKAAHKLVLEGKADEIVIAPQVDRRTKAGKEAHKSFSEQNDGKIIVSEEEHRQLLGMRLFFENNPCGELLKILDEVEKVVVTKEKALFDLFWEDGFKAMVDGVSHRGKFILEYKTTQDASPDCFFWDIKRYKYAEQLLFYKKLLLLTGQIDESYRLIIIAQEKTEPFAVTQWVVNETRSVMDSFSNLIKKAASSLERHKEGIVGYQPVWNEYNG